MANTKIGNTHNGNHPIPCFTCGHGSRDHSRCKKQNDGTWNGKCTEWNCECKLYVRGRFL